MGSASFLSLTLPERQKDLIVDFPSLSSSALVCALTAIQLMALSRALAERSLPRLLLERAPVEAS